MAKKPSIAGWRKEKYGWIVWCWVVAIRYRNGPKDYWMHDPEFDEFLEQEKAVYFLWLGFRRVEGRAVPCRRVSLG